MDHILDLVGLLVITWKINCRKVIYKRILPKVKYYRQYMQGSCIRQFFYKKLSFKMKQFPEVSINVTGIFRVLANFPLCHSLTLQGGKVLGRKQVYQHQEWCYRAGRVLGEADSQVLSLVKKLRQEETSCLVPFKRNRKLIL